MSSDVFVQCSAAHNKIKTIITPGIESPPPSLINRTDLPRESKRQERKGETENHFWIDV